MERSDTWASLALSKTQLTIDQWTGVKSWSRRTVVRMKSEGSHLKYVFVHD